MVKKFKEYLIEMVPKLNDDERLSYYPLSKISSKQLTRAYTHFKSLTPNYFMYKKGNNFIVVTPHGDDYYIVLNIITRTNSFPNTPINLKNPLQISMVKVSEGFEEQGLAKLAYVALNQSYDLVSDSEQYQASKGLWISLARTEIVYVYNCITKTYTKFNEETYHGDVWSKSEKYRNLLLVATINSVESK